MILRQCPQLRRVQPSFRVFRVLRPLREFALKLLHEERVAVVSGTAFGACGEGFVRCAYATSMENINEAMARLARFTRKLGKK